MSSILLFLAKHKIAILLAVSIISVASYVLPLDNLFSIVSAQRGPPGGQYGPNQGCPPGFAHRPPGAPVPPGLVGRCP